MARPFSVVQLADFRAGVLGALVDSRSLSQRRRELGGESGVAAVAAPSGYRGGEAAGGFNVMFESNLANASCGYAAQVGWTPTWATH